MPLPVHFIFPRVGYQFVQAALKQFGLVQDALDRVDPNSLIKRRKGQEIGINLRFLPQPLLYNPIDFKRIGVHIGKYLSSFVGHEPQLFEAADTFFVEFGP